jgi:imidazolonepropionase-like amidohydrolase
MFLLLQISCMLLVAVLAKTALAQPALPVTAIIGAHVLPMAGDTKLKDQTVLISGDRIVEVGPRRSVRIPPGARRIEAAGMTLMPGLVDMHVHLAPVPGAAGDAAQRALAVMLAHGITTARGMAGSPANLAVRDAIEQGRLAGPRFYAAAPGINVQNTQSAEQARTAVRHAKQAGYDLIKSHHIVDVAIWDAVREEATKQGLPTAGHVANQVGLARAMAAGQQIEHLDGFLLELLPADSPLRSADFAQIPPPPVMQAAAEAGDARIAALAAQAAGARSYQVPTLALFEGIVDIGSPTEELLDHPDMRYVPDAALQQWAAQRGELQKAGFTPADGDRFRDIRRRIVAALHEAGVPIMTGSDTAQAFHIWGPGLIREMRALGRAGLSPMEALRSATVVPRDYFRSLPNGGSSRGWKADFGTVTEGARADLILLRNDPSANLAALVRPEAVIAGGRVYDRPALDAMLKKAAADAKLPPPVQETPK